MLSKPLDRRIDEYNSIFYLLSYFTFVCWTLLSTLVVVVVVVYLLFFKIYLIRHFPFSPVRVALISSSGRKVLVTAQRRSFRLEKHRGFFFPSPD